LHWSGTGTISGEGTAEKITLASGDEEESDTWELGVGIARVLINKYEGEVVDVTVYYKTGNSIANCEAEGWTEYIKEFSSLGFVRLKVVY